MLGQLIRANGKLGGDECTTILVYNLLEAAKAVPQAGWIQIQVTI